MMPMQRSQLGDDERDLIMSAALSKSPKQVASMALKIDSIKDEIVLNLMGFLMAHYSFRAVPACPATAVNEPSCGADDDDKKDSDDTSDDSLGCPEADDSSHVASLASSGDDRMQPPLSASEDAYGTVGGHSRCRFPLGSPESMELGWEPTVESPGSSRRLRRGRSGNAGTSMAPVPVRSASPGWSLPPGGVQLCVLTRSTPELVRSSKTAASSIELAEQPIAERVRQKQLPPSPATSDSTARRPAAMSTAVAGTNAERWQQQAVVAQATALPSLAEAPADGRPGFTCSHCGRYFRNAEALKFHAAKHLGVEYQCPLCKQCLKTSNSYSNHMKMHSGYDGHRCSVCHKHFMRRHEMVRHVKIVHMGERPFACPDCGTAFATEWNMLRHRKSMHAAGGASAGAQSQPSVGDNPSTASATAAGSSAAAAAHSDNSTDGEPGSGSRTVVAELQRQPLLS